MSTAVISHEHTKNQEVAALRRGYAANSAQILGGGFKSSFVSDTTPIVFVLDEDDSLRQSLERLIRREGWQPQTFASAVEILAQPRASVPNCLLLNISFPEFNGLELQEHFATERPGMSIIFMANNVDIATAVQAIKAGAVELFLKPFREDALLSSLREGLERSRITLGHEVEMQPLRDRYASLSRREREVMTLVVSGLLNKQTAGELGISEKTVKAHRGQVMQKMKADSVAHLVKMAAKLEVAAVPNSVIRERRVETTNGEKKAETAEKTCTSITVIQNKKSHPGRRGPRILSKVLPVYPGLREKQKLVGQSEEAWPIGVSLSGRKRGMGYDFSAKFTGANRGTARISQGRDAWPDDRVGCEGA